MHSVPIADVVVLALFDRMAAELLNQIIFRRISSDDVIEWLTTDKKVIGNLYLTFL